MLNSTVYLAIKITGWILALIFSCCIRSKKNLVLGLCLSCVLLSLNTLDDYTKLDPRISFASANCAINYLFFTLNIFSLEVFPTPSRALALAVMSNVFWVSLLWSYYLQMYSQRLLSFGVIFMLLAGIVLLFKLRETGRRPLLDTIEEIGPSSTAALDESSIIIKRSSLKDNSHSRGRSFNVLHEDGSAIED